MNKMIDYATVLKLHLAMLIIVGMCWPISSAYAATTYYVATNGNDAYSNILAQNISTPKKTIWAGIQCLAGGDRLEIRGGTYSNNSSVGVGRAFPSGTSWSNATTITAYNGETVTINFVPELVNNAYYAAGFSFTSYDFNLGNRSDKFIIIKDLILDGSNCGYSGIYVGQGAEYIRFQNLEVRHWGGQALSTCSDMKGIEVIGGYFHDSGFIGASPQTHHIYWSSDYGLIDGVTFDYSPGGPAVQLYDDYKNADGTGQTVNHNIIRNCKIYNTPAGDGLAIDGADNEIYNNIFYNNFGNGIGIGYSGGHRNKIYNNVFYKNADHGVSIGAYNVANDNEIKNNIFLNNGGCAIAIGDIYSAGNNTIIQNNIFYQNGGGGVDVSIYSGSGTVQGGNLFNTDPRVVNAAGFDFRLQSSSPAIDGGLTLTTPNKDFLGNARPSGSAYDIGAYEYGGVVNPTPVPPPAPTPTPAPILSLAYVGRVRDVVSNSGSISTDGVNDVRFDATLSSSKNITKFVVNSTSTGGAWDTDPFTPQWSLGTSLTPTGSLINTGSGVNFTNTSFSVFASDSSSVYFPAGGQVNLTAYYSDGTSSVGSVSIPTPPPSNAPPTAAVSSASISTDTGSRSSKCGMGSGLALACLLVLALGRLVVVPPNRRFRACRPKA